MPSPKPRPGSPTRDRRDRGRRGPDFLPGPLTPDGVPAHRSGRETFDRIVLSVVEEIEDRWSARLGFVEFAVEEIPLVPDDWAASTVPLATLVRGSGTEPTRLVLFRRPLEHRCEDRADLAALVLTVVVEQVADLLGIPPEDVDPRYDAG